MPSPRLLPEILIEILGYLKIPLFLGLKERQHINLQPLYSCLCVSKQWYTIVAPLLWDQPFSYIGYESEKDKLLLVNVYLEFISQLDRENIEATGITFPKNFRQPYLHYPSFLKNMHYGVLLDAVQLWCQKNSEKTMKPSSVTMTLETILKLFSKSDGVLTHMSATFGPRKKGVCMYPVLKEAEIAELVKSVKFLYIGGWAKKAELFEMLANNCQNLQVLKISIIHAPTDSHRTSEITCNNLASLIRNQRHITEFELADCLDHIDAVMEALSIRSATLTKLSFKKCSFSGCRKWEGFSNCTGLKSFVISRCFLDNDDETIFDTIPFEKHMQTDAA
ncbi:5278_t:CDS:2, partial [Ambispora gerdemannii]